MSKINVITVENIIKYNVLKPPRKKKLIGLPSYVVEAVINENKKLILTHDNKVLREFDKESLVLNIKRTIDKKYNGIVKGKSIQYNIIIVEL